MSHAMHTWSGIFTELFNKYLNYNYLSSIIFIQDNTENENLKNEIRKLNNELDNQKEITNFWKSMFEKTAIKYKNELINED
jgi:hypothetical protein